MRPADLREVPSPPLILVVDDESRIVNSIRRIFAAGALVRVETATSPLAALELVNRRPDLRLVISDYLMPEMNGLDFLIEVGRRRPDIIRMVLTGHANLETTLRAINEVGVYKFILKPWNNDDLYWTVIRALELEAARRENRSLRRRLDAQKILLERVEGLYPGITRIERDAEGAIVIDED